MIQGFPDVNVHGAEFTAPAAATVLADTGQMIAGQWVLSVIMSATESNRIIIAHRNAANTADLETVDSQTTTANLQLALNTYFVLLANERVVVRNFSAGAAGQIYQAHIAAFLNMIYA